MAALIDQQTVNQGFGTSATTPALAATAVGDLYIITGRERDNTAFDPTTPFQDSLTGGTSGWATARALGDATNGKAFIAWKIATAAGTPTATVTFNAGSVFNFTFSAYSPTATFTWSALDQTNDLTNGSGTSHSHGSITTTGRGLCITACAANTDFGAKTPNADFTILTVDAAAGDRSYYQYRVTTAPVTTTGAFTSTNATTSNGAIASFLETGGGGDVAWSAPVYQTGAAPPVAVVASGFTPPQQQD